MTEHHKQSEDQVEKDTKSKAIFNDLSKLVQFKT